MAAAGSTLGTPETIWSVPEDLVEEALRGPGLETFKHSVCRLCPAGCGIRVRLVDGVPVHIDGNPMHPVNQGGICPHGAAGLDFLYNPDRVRQPLLRDGPKASGRWKEIDWNEALSRVAERLGAMRENQTPERLAFLVRDKRGLMTEFISHFMRAFGSDNLVATREGRVESLPFQLLYGWKQVPGYDIANTRFLLSFGANFLEDGASPVHTAVAYGKMRSTTGGKERGRMVSVDCRHSLTSASADEFIPIKPGTHGAFALGVAYVMIKERYYDPSFVAAHVQGFEPWTDAEGTAHKGFQEVVLESYYPERVARITGAPARKIVELAREFGRRRPALALAGQLGTDSTNGLWNALAVQTLNVLVGNVEKTGGLRLPRELPYGPFHSPRPDALPETGEGKRALSRSGSRHSPFQGDDFLAFCDAVLDGKPYPIDTLFVYGTNPAFDHPHARKVRRVLDKIPFIVSFAGIPDETSEYADIILPDHSYLEGWMDSDSAPGTFFPNASVSQPVVDPFYDTRHSGDVLIELSKLLGGQVAESIPYAGFRTALQERYQAVYRSGEGAVISGTFEESWIRFLKERGWHGLVYESFKDFWKILIERGGWWAPVSESLRGEAAILTADGKISLTCVSRAARTSAGEGESGAHETVEEVLRRSGVREKGDTALVPHYEEPVFAGNKSEYPYVLVTFGVLSNRDGSGSCSPLLQEMFGYYRGVHWDSWVELNPHTAEEHGIREGEWTELTSPEGALKVRAVYNELLEPHTVAVPFGLGHTSGGRYASNIGVNPYEILSEQIDPLWGRPAVAATRVHIRKSKRRSA